MNTVEKPWTAAEEDKFRRMWDAGDSSALIAEKLHRGKGSITGKARRLGLAMRGTPILCGVPAKPRAETPKGKLRPSAPRLAELVALSPPLVSVPAEDVPPPVRTLAEAEPLMPPPGAPLHVTTRTCSFPLWGDATPRRERRMCEAPVARGMYCAVHADACYVKPTGFGYRPAEGLARIGRS